MREIAHLRLVLQDSVVVFCQRLEASSEDVFAVQRRIDATLDLGQVATTRRYVQERDVDNARLYDEAQAANRAKDDFLATLSHELRSPLTTMLGWASMLRAGTLDRETASRGLALLEEGARQQRRLIDELLDVSSIISGKVQLELQVVDLSTLVRKAAESLLPAAEAKSIRLDCAFQVPDAFVSADPARLEQVVCNLLTNALKFTGQGGSIQVALTRHGSRLRLTVSDNGKGITPEFLPYVFHRFRQEDSSHGRAHGGLGLGLTIVDHLVKLHGGTIEAESPGEGQGSSFHVELPGVSKVRGSAGARDESVGLASYPPELEESRVLVVEDEGEIRELLTVMLRLCRARVTAVSSSHEAVRYLESEDADVLVSDIGLPGEDGYALIRQIREREKERGGRLPALALSGYARLEDQEKARAAGFQRHLAKPVEFAEFIATVASLIPPRERVRA